MWKQSKLRHILSPRLNIYTAACIAAAALALQSCSSTSSDDDVAAGVELRFSASAADGSRATTTLTTSATLNDFKVWGTYRTKVGGSWSAQPVNVFNGVTVNKGDDGNWSYANASTPLQYWFPGCYYTFRAIHPVTVNAAFTPGSNAASDRLSVTSFDATSGIDLVAATHTRESLLQGNTVVSLDFRHLLSRVDITASVDKAVTGTFVITGIKLYGFDTVGSWSSDGMTANTYGKWDNLSGRDNAYTVDGLNITLSSEPQSLLSGGNTVLMLPQAIPVGAKADITYTENGTEKTVTADIYKASYSLTGGYQPSRTYRYSFTIGPDQYILFSKPEVVSWVDTGGSNVIIQPDK